MPLLQLQRALLASPIGLIVLLNKAHVCCLLASMSRLYNQCQLLTSVSFIFFFCFLFPKLQDQIDYMILEENFETK